MNYKVDTTPNFEREAKKLFKKYNSLKEELLILIDELETNPSKGIKLGEKIYKIRIAIKSKGKGKRGGGRILTYFKVSNETVYLLAIYSKGEKDDVSDKEVKQLIKEIL